MFGSRLPGSLGYSCQGGRGQSRQWNTDQGGPSPAHDTRNQPQPLIYLCRCKRSVYGSLVFLSFVCLRDLSCHILVCDFKCIIKDQKIFCFVLSGNTLHMHNAPSHDIISSLPCSVSVFPCNPCWQVIENMFAAGYPGVGAPLSF